MPTGTSRRNPELDVATVHRLNDLGAVVTPATHATSQEGVEIESGEIIVLMVEGDLFNRCEIFDEADLDAALADVRGAHPRTAAGWNSQCKSASSRTSRRATGKRWTDFADGFSSDDRRRVVNAGVRHGRDAEIEDMRAAADLGLMTDVGRTSLRPAATASSSVGPTDRAGQRPEDSTEVLNIVEIDADERIAALVMFDPTTSTPPSRSSMLGTSPAKRPPTRRRGRSSPGLRRVQPARAPRRRRTGSTSTTGGSSVREPVI